MNAAYDQLKTALQNWQPLFDSQCLRLSKIEVLRCASRYIRHLNAQLGNPVISEDSMSESSAFDSD